MTDRKGKALGRWVLGVLVALAVLEGVNVARMAAADRDQGRWPYDFVSKNLWSLGAFVRPLDRESGDLRPMLDAMARVRAGRSAYADFEEAGREVWFPYLYPPAGTALMWWLGAVAERWGEARAVQLWDLVGRVAALGLVGLALWVVRRGLGGVGSRWTWVGLGAVFLAYFPLRWGLMCVNVQTVVSLLLAGVVVAYARGRDGWAGVLLALAAGLKPIFGIFVVFALVRRRWRLAAWCLGGVAALSAISVAAWGWGPWDTWLEVMGAGSSGYAAWANQSWVGLLLRWAGHEPSMFLAEESALVAWLGRAGGVVFLVAAIWPRGVGTRARQDLWLGRLVDGGLGMLLMMMASPVVWDHYYAWCLVLVAGALALGVRAVAEEPRAGSPRDDRPQAGSLRHERARGAEGWLVMLGVGYALMGTWVMPVKVDGDGPMSVVNSWMFVGAVVLAAGAWGVISLNMKTHK